MQIGAGHRIFPAIRQGLPAKHLQQMPQMGGLRQNRSEIHHIPSAANQQRRKTFDVQIADYLGFIFDIQPTEKHLRKFLAHRGKGPSIFTTSPTPFCAQTDNPELRIHRHKGLSRRRPPHIAALPTCCHTRPRTDSFAFFSIDHSDAITQRPPFHQQPTLHYHPSVRQANASTDASTDRSAQTSASHFPVLGALFLRVTAHFRH